MKDYQIAIYTKSGSLPTMSCRNFFHSSVLFRLYEQTPRHKPYMVVAQSDDGKVLAHLMAIIRYRWSIFPPYIYSHCRVFGEGDYEVGDIPEETLFAAMIEALCKKMRHKVLYMEFSHLSSKMFGYKVFRQHGFFPVHWMSIHNSLHSKSPEEWVSARTLSHIQHAEERGVETVIVKSEQDFLDFTQLLRRHNLLKPRKFTPDAKFFHGLMQTENASLFLTRHHGHAIGCCACVYSGGNAYLWYSASLRKTYIKFHPDIMNIWAAIQNAYQKGLCHIYFMDVGLPFRRNPFRDFILRFGGKPVSTYRWFLIYSDWLNRLFSWIYRD